MPETQGISEILLYFILTPIITNPWISN